MKTLLKLGLLALALVVLAACDIVISPSDPDDPRPGSPPNFELLSFRYATDYEADLDGDGRYQDVICNDRTTRLIYSIEFEGELDRWTSYLYGVETRDEVGYESFDRRDSRVNSYGEGVAEVEYTIPEGLAPQGIVPTPRTLGYTQLVLEVNGYDETYTSREIPVLATCGR